MKDIGALLADVLGRPRHVGIRGRRGRLLRKEIEPLVDEVQTDKMGNVIGIRRGEGPKVMVAAHMDEIGLAVSHIDDEGFLKFVSVGGFFDPIILGQRVLIHGQGGKVLTGVVGARPIHLMDAEERKKMRQAQGDVRGLRRQQRARTPRSWGSRSARPSPWTASSPAWPTTSSPARPSTTGRAWR